MIEQQDHVQAAEIMRLFNLCGTKMSGGEDYQTLLRQLSAHRQQAEDAMRERCAQIADDRGTALVNPRAIDRMSSQSVFDRHDECWHIATAIRGIDAVGEGE